MRAVSRRNNGFGDFAGDDSDKGFLMAASDGLHVVVGRPLHTEMSLDEVYPHANETLVLLLPARDSSGEGKVASFFPSPSPSGFFLTYGACVIGWERERLSAGESVYGSVRVSESE